MEVTTITHLKKEINMSNVSQPVFSVLEAELWWQIKAAKINIPTVEFKFHKKNKRYPKARRWRADFCWVPQKLIVEVEGGIYTSGRHVRGKGFEGDCEKYNEAQMLGYSVLRVTSKHIKSGQALNWIEDFLTI